MNYLRLFLSVLLLLSFPIKAYADNAVTMTYKPSPLFANSPAVNFTFQTSPDNPIFTVKPQSGYNTYTLALWRPGADASNIKELTFYYHVTATQSASLGNMLETGDFDLQKKYEASTNATVCDNIFSCLGTALIPGGGYLVGYQIAKDITGNKVIPIQMNTPGYWTLKLYREQFQPKTEDKQKDDPKTGLMYVDQPKFNTLIPLYEGGYRVYPICDETKGCIALRISPSQIKNGQPYDLYIINAIPGQTYTVWYMKNGVTDASAIRSAKPNMDIMKPGTFGDIAPDGTPYPIGTLTKIGSQAKSPFSDIKNNILCVSAVGTALDSFSTNQLTCDFWFNLNDVLRNASDPNTADDVNYTVLSNQPGLPHPDEPLIDESSFKKKTTPPPCSKDKDAFQNGLCARFDTAIGPIDTTPMGFVKSVFGILLSLAGVIALIIIIYSGYLLIMSQGNPEKIQGAKDSITSAIVGLLFMIFSIIIMQFIGVNILQLPGFGK